MSDSQDWSATQAKLLQDIDAFARSKVDLAALHAAEQTSRNASAPAVAANAGAVRPAAAAAATPASAPSSPPPAAAAPGGSLLEKLKREALEQKMSESQRFTLQSQQKGFISEALRRAFDYFRELTEQLNVLKPPVPTEYNFLNLATLDGLVWQEGRADFRLLPAASDDRLLEQVTLRYRLHAGRDVKVTRESPAHEAFAAQLMEANIVFDTEEIRNAKNGVERAVFTFPCEVKAGLGLMADYKLGDIRLVLRNVRRFGGATYRVPHDALDQGTLEELAHLLLGEESRFEKMFRRVA